jgi:hypothetical protein
MRTQPIHKKEVRLKQKREKPRKLKNRVKPNTNKMHLKQQPLGTNIEQVKQQSRLKPMNQEKPIHVPVKKQLKKSGREIPKPSPQRRPRTRQLNQKKGAAEKPPVNTQTKTVKKALVINKPASPPARPRRATPQHHIAKQQPQSKSLSQKTGQVSKRVNPVQTRKVKQKVAAKTTEKIEQKTKHQSRQEIGRKLPQIERRRHR